MGVLFRWGEAQCPGEGTDALDAGAGDVFSDYSAYVQPTFQKRRIRRIFTGCIAD